MRYSKFFDKLFVVCITIFFGIVLFYLTFLSMFSTSVMNYFEHTYYLPDHPWLHLFSIAVTVLLVTILRRKFPSFSIPKKALKLLISILLLGSLLWVSCTQLFPRADQKYVLAIAAQMREYNFSSFMQDGYVGTYPNQLGIILYFYGLTFLFGTFNYVTMQFLNVFWLAVTYLFLYKINKLLFDERLAGPALLSFALFFPLSYYVTFVYGNITGLALSLGGLYYAILYFQKEKISQAIVSSLLLSISVLIKQNYLITFIAVFLLGFMHTVVKKRIKPLLFLFFLVSFYLIANGALEKTITSITKIDLSKGTPSTSFIAMGLQEGSRAPGWYNEYNFNVYKDHHYDFNAANKDAQQNIQASLQNFCKNPTYAKEFFSMKLASQWNNPSFQCFFITYRRGSDIQIPSFALHLMKENANSPIFRLLNLVQTLLLFGAFAYLIMEFKNLRYYHLSYALIFLGGFFFHLLWEAKGQYTLPYFVLLIPYSIKGYSALAECCAAIPLAQKPSPKVLLQNKVLLLGLVMVLFTLLFSAMGTSTAYPIKLRNDKEQYQDYLKGEESTEVKNGYYLIHPNGMDDYVLFPIKNKMENGIPIGLKPYSNAMNQTVSIYRNENYDTIRFKFSQKVLGVNSDNPSETRILQDNKSQTTLWRINKIPDTKGYTIRYGRDSALTFNAVTRQVSLEPFSGGSNQIWILSPVK